ncbi:unnamed protein product [Blepharisma stoltei]|uniref:Uncharacterized protein n=1 Tax=Blepharisma stoltei TaxID=1481888 RepID=A0AAU9K9P4_9CILI|nr:unnamed protein product [Blepharisma stoltei]
MGACCSANSSGKIILIYKSREKELNKRPKSLQELKDLAKKKFKELKSEKIALHINGNFLRSDKDVLSLYSKSHTVSRIEIAIFNPDMESNSVDSCFILTSGDFSCMAFRTNLNLVMTSSKVITSPEKALNAQAEVELDPKKFFYRSPALCFALVAVKNEMQRESLQLASKEIRIDDVVYINNSMVKVTNVDPYKLSYEFDALPGLPIIKDGRVVGMHLTRNTGVKTQAIISELQSVSEHHMFSEKINLLLAQVVFYGDLPSLTTRFYIIYTLKSGGLTSFNTATHEFKNFDLSLPKNAKIAQAQTGVYIIGGTLDGFGCKNAFYFDTYTEKLNKKSDMISSRHSHTVIANESFIYAISGYGSLGLSRECEIYDIENEKWSSIEPLETPRANASAAIFKNAVYVAGGDLNSGECCKYIEKYTSSSWSTLSLRIPERISNIKILCDNRNLLVLGKSLWALDGKEWKVQTKEVDPLPGIHAVCLDSKVFAFIAPTIVFINQKNEWEPVSI